MEIQRNVLDNCSSVDMGNYDSFSVLMLPLPSFYSTNRLTDYLRHITQ